MAKTVKLQANIEGKYVSIGLVGENSMMMPLTDPEMIGDTIVSMVRKAQEAGNVSSETEQGESRAAPEDEERQRRREGYGDVDDDEGGDGFYEDPITQAVFGFGAQILSAMSSRDQGKG